MSGTDASSAVVRHAEALPGAPDGASGGDLPTLRLAMRGEGRVELVEVVFGRDAVVVSRAVFERFAVGRAV